MKWIRGIVTGIIFTIALLLSSCSKREAVRLCQAKQDLLEQGVTIVEPTEEELALFREACELIWYDLDHGAYNDLLDRIVAAGRVSR